MEDPQNGWFFKGKSQSKMDDVAIGVPPWLWNYGFVWKFKEDPDPTSVVDHDGPQKKTRRSMFGRSEGSEELSQSWDDSLHKSFRKLASIVKGNIFANLWKNIFVFFFYN